ncbi:hypothetical protein D3C72_1393420 [compost metagenome]
MGTAVGDEHRRQFSAYFDPVEHDTLEHFFPGLTQDDVKAQAFAELGAEVRNAGITRQQQPLRSADAQAHADGVAFHPRALVVIFVQPALTIAQIHFALHSTLTKQCRLQRAQVSAYIAIGGQVFHQHVENTATR